MTEIYSAVEERLTAQVPELLYIDLESGQLEGQTPPSVEFPCALVDVRFNKCEDQSAKVQQCEVTVTVRVAFEAWIDETSSVTPKQWKHKALEKMQLPDKVYCALQGWGMDFFSSLSRKSVIPEQRADGLKVYRIEFETTQEDYAE